MSQLQKSLQRQINTESVSTSLLDQAIAATKQTDPKLTQQLLQTFTAKALEGAITWDRNITNTIQKTIAEVDKMISIQLADILHHPTLQQCEGTWRGLHYLVKNSLCNNMLKIRMLDISKQELAKDLDKAIEFDQSEFFKKIYEREYGTPGGEPFGVLLGDYEFSHHAEDVRFLDNISHIAAAAFCPFIASASVKLLGLEDWSALSKPRDLEKIFNSIEYSQWRGFRENEDSRYVSLVMPRVLARLPYSKATKSIEAFDFEEIPLTEQGIAKTLSSQSYCWMNAAYVLGTRLSNAFSEYGWCTSIRGAEGGGKVEGLPTHVFMSDDGDIDMRCPTEVGITDRREAELSKMGLLPLCHYKNTDFAVFFGAQTTHKPKQYDQPQATANANISAKLPFIMASSRFAHYLKILARDKIGSFMQVEDAEKWLNGWFINYVNANPDSGAETKAKYPLAEARITVKEVLGRPGSYHAVAWLRPWLQLEELTTSLRLVARVPELK